MMSGFVRHGGLRRDTLGFLCKRCITAAESRRNAVEPDGDGWGR